VPSEALKPIYSTLGDDPSSGATVDAFVVGLAERIDVLQDAEAVGDLAQLANLANRLIADASESGFADFEQVGKELEAACYEKDGAAARQRLVELTNLSQRIRLGHKGAA
jgi:hypothetical protein